MLKFIFCLLSLIRPKKPKRSKLLAPLVDPRFAQPAYKNIPEELLRAIEDPTFIRNLPYQYGYYGLISGEYCMREFQKKLFGKLKRQSGVSPEEFTNYLEPILIAYAELVHLLPASEHRHHNTPGGLLRHGLETACFMLDWMVLTRHDNDLPQGQASKRLRRWYVAGITAALFYDVGKTLTDVRVTNTGGDKQWLLGTKTIHEWAVENDINRYFVKWEKHCADKHLAHSIVLIGTLVTPQIRTWLIEGGWDIWQALLDAISGNNGPLTTAVNRADIQSVRANRNCYGNSHSEPIQKLSTQQLCVDAINFLLAEGSWTFNEPGSRLWRTAEGVFLVWSTGAPEIIQHVIQDKVEGFPNSKDNLLAAMSERELIDKDPEGSLFWYVAPHILQKGSKGPSLRCVKLQRPLEIFPRGLDNVSIAPATIGLQRQPSLPTETQNSVGAVVSNHLQSAGSSSGMTSPSYVEANEKRSIPLLIPHSFEGRLSDEDADYLRANPALGSRLLREFERKVMISELQNRAFLLLTDLITEEDLPALSDAGWLWPNLATTSNELKRTRRGETGVMLNTRLSLIFCQLTDAEWFPRCHATMPEGLRSQVFKHVIALAPHVCEEMGRGVKAFSVSFWARDRFQNAYNLSQDEMEQVILYGFEAVKVSNARKYYFAADIEFQF
jgi:hypothetical protein